LISNGDVASSHPIKLIERDNRAISNIALALIIEFIIIIHLKEKKSQINKKILEDKKINEKSGINTLYVAEM